MENVAKLETLEWARSKTYGCTALFVLGNLWLPQLFHLVPQGGATWLPIYFFTLIGAYRYGVNVGLLTAAASPLFSAFVFGMPAAAILPVVLFKSAALALAGAFAAKKARRVSLGVLACVVGVAAVAGAIFEGVYFGDFGAAATSLQLGLPGYCLQIFGGYGLLKIWTR